MSDPLILIPARLAATRLPNKPLADINGQPMIVHVWRRAMEAGIGPVAVATDSVEIARAVDAAGGVAVMTRVDHQSGSDRIKEAADALDPEGRHDVIVNLQGDFPTIDPAAIAISIEPLADPAVAIATLAAEIIDEDEKTAPSVVKLIGTMLSPGRMRALYFTRATAPTGEGPLYHHVGVYAYRRRALERFVSLPPSPLEQREKLEQLRALEDGMRIDARLIGHVPRGVDTQADLERARTLL
jgi:3-deoxy-manno-octulosonate cytidylyltransferase (CMP-KDO synthetase)